MAARVDTGPTVSLEEAKQQIDASFRAAKETPVHPTREGILPVQVMPLLPFFERYGHMHVTASSTSEVVTHVLAEGTSEQDRETLYGECMMRTYPLRVLPPSHAHRLAAVPDLIFTPLHFLPRVHFRVFCGLQLMAKLAASTLLCCCHPTGLQSTAQKKCMGKGATGGPGSLHWTHMSLGM